MANTIIMSKYQGLGNDYLILDPKKNQVQLQGKKIALLCQRGFGLGADGVLYGCLLYTSNHWFSELGVAFTGFYTGQKGTAEIWQTDRGYKAINLLLFTHHYPCLLYTSRCV